MGIYNWRGYVAAELLTDHSGELLSVPVLSQKPILIPDGVCRCISSQLKDPYCVLKVMSR